MKTENTRNFCIIAHIDHGKSTLADRLLLRTGAISEREFRDQVLDDMDLERERGITIKARAVALNHLRNGTPFTLNLIDTPGHVDFSYEVSRSLAACEGALLLVDASQGVEAQTVANVYLAMEHDLAIIPVINKIDLAQARPQQVAEEICGTLGVEQEDLIFVSARDGTGVEAVFNAIVDRIPPPEGAAEGPPRALVFDSVFNEFRGVIVYVRIVDGRLRVGDEIRMMKGDQSFRVEEVGVFKPEMAPCESLSTGQVGYFMANIKNVHTVVMGDTVTHRRSGATEALPAYREPKPMVFCGLFSAKEADFTVLRDALQKLWLNDPAFTYQPESSLALGHGFRCGFLGMLHMEIVQERLERESGVELVQTAPNVTYEVLTRKDEVLRINNPVNIPSAGEIAELREPVVHANIVLPADYIGSIMQLAAERRGRYVRTEYLSEARAILVYDLPLAEIIFDFYDKLKSATRGYGTLDYELTGYERAELVRLDMLVGGRPVDALSTIVHRENAPARGKALAKRLTKEIPRHLFEVVIQAAVGSKVVARETIPPLSKHVTSKCYGGDITRKRKLWAKQREGKKRLKNVGNVDIPQEAFLSVLSVER